MKTFGIGVGDVSIIGDQKNNISIRVEGRSSAVSELWKYISTGARLRRRDFPSRTKEKCILHGRLCCQMQCLNFRSTNLVRIRTDKIMILEEMRTMITKQLEQGQLQIQLC